MPNITNLPPLSVVIPTWNARRFLPACLQALHSQLAADDEIILVDNRSRDQAAAWARRHAPDVRLVELPVNRGFAGGTNAGIRAARHDLLLLCNDDALVEPGCVAALRQALVAQHPTARQLGSAAGVLTFSICPERVASAGIIVQRDGVALDGWLGQPVTALPTTAQPVFGPSGGLALLRREMLADIGLFEERFFNYLEDVDLAWRAQLRGWDAVLVPQARARHVYSASGSGLKQRLLGRNRLRVIMRCWPTALLQQCWRQILWYDVLAMAYGLLWQQPAIVAGRLAAFHEYRTLLEQRRTIQARRTAPIDDLAHWLQPAATPLAALRMQRRLAAILHKTKHA